MKKTVILVVVAILLIGIAFYIISTLSNKNDVKPLEEVVVDPLEKVLMRAGDIQFISYTVAIISDFDESIFDFHQNKERISASTGEGEDRLVAYINTANEDYFGHFPELGVIVPLDINYLLEITDVSAIGLADYLLREEAVIVDNEIIDGENYLIVEHTDGMGRDMTFWIWEDYGIPISIEIYAGDDDFSMIDFYDISFDAISDDVLTMPEDIEISR